MAQNPYLRDAINPLKRWWELYPEHERRARNLLSSSVSEDTPWYHKAWQAPLGLLSYVGSPVTSGFQALRDEPIRDVMIKEFDVNPETAQKVAHGIGMAMDVAIPVGAAKSGATVSQALAQRLNPNVGPAALTQNIIRRDTAQQAEGSTILPPWYSTTGLSKNISKPLHMAAGGFRGLGDMVQMLVSPKASHLFKKYGISPSMARDLRRDFATQAEMLKGPVQKRGRLGKESDETVDPHVLRNQIHARLTYMDSVLRKYMPDDKRRQAFEAELSGFLFPTQRYTTAANLATDATPLREVLDLPAQISDRGILDHLNPFIKKWWNLKGSIAINAKALQEHPRNTLYTRAKESGKVTPIQDFLDIWRQMDEPLTKANVLNFARGHNKALQDLMDEAYKTALNQRKSAVYANTHANRTSGRAGQRKYTDDQAEAAAEKARTTARQDLAKKHSSERFYDIKAIEKELLDEGDYISMGGEMLSADRLLAHVQNRIVIPKNSPDEGVWTVLDIMRQGQSDIPFVGKALEKTFETGSKYDFVVGEVYPVTRIGGEGAARKIDAERGAGTWGVESFQTKKPPTAQTDAAIRDITEGMLASRPAMGEVVEKFAPLAAVGSAAAYDQYRRQSPVPSVPDIAGRRKRKPPPQQGLLGPY